MQLTHLVALIEQAQPLADNFVRGAVKPGFHLAMDEIFEFGRKADMHKEAR